MKSRTAKRICLVVLLALVNQGRLRAQTNTNVVVVEATNAANVVLPPKPRPPTLISSDRGEFDMAGRRVIYHGHVQVDDPAMKLTCEWLTADLPGSGERMTNVVAKTNVVIDFTDEKGQTMHATGNQAVYVYTVQDSVTNETITLTGNAQVENAQGTLTGEPIVWDRANNRLSAVNQRMVFRQNLNGTTPGTNSPPATNAPAAAPR